MPVASAISSGGPNRRQLGAEESRQGTSSESRAKSSQSTLARLRPSSSGAEQNTSSVQPSSATVRGRVTSQPATRPVPDVSSPSQSVSRRVQWVNSSQNHQWE